MYDIAAVIKYSANVFRVYSAREVRIAVVFAVSIGRADPLRKKERKKNDNYD